MLTDLQYALGQLKPLTRQTILRMNDVADRVQRAIDALERCVEASQQIETSLRAVRRLVADQSQDDVVLSATDAALAAAGMPAEEVAASVSWKPGDRCSQCGRDSCTCAWR